MGNNNRTWIWIMWLGLLFRINWQNIQSRDRYVLWAPVNIGLRAYARIFIFWYLPKWFDGIWKCCWISISDELRFKAFGAFTFGNWLRIMQIECLQCVRLLQKVLLAYRGIRNVWWWKLYHYNYFICLTMYAIVRFVDDFNSARAKRSPIPIHHHHQPSDKHKLPK